MKVILIHPKADNLVYYNVAYKTIYPPVQLEIIASCLKKNNKDVNIKIYDNRIIEKEKIVSDFKNVDHVGVSIWSNNYITGLDFLKSAKKENPEIKTSIGGPYAKCLKERILLNNKFVDYVCYDKGDDTLPKIIENKNPIKIPNLIYRNDKKILRSGYEYIPLSEQPFFTLEHTVDLDKYVLNEYISEADIGFPIPLTEGCIKAQEKGKCIFCIVGGKVSVLPPEKAYLQLVFLKEKYGITRFLDTGDNFVLVDYLKELIEMGIPKLNLSFMIEADIENTNEKTLPLMKQLGVDYIFLGVESLDKSVLKKANKDLKGNLEDTLKLLKKYEIKTALSIVWGLPGESYQSAENTYKNLKNLIEKYEDVILTIRSRLVIPYCDTQLFNMLLRNEKITNIYKKETGKDLKYDDKFNYSLLIEQMVNNFCKINLKDLLYYVNLTHFLVPEEKRSNPHIWDLDLMKKYKIKL